MSESEEVSLNKGRRESKTVGSYILGAELGEGAFGKVKVATHIHTGEKVAIKILDKDQIMQEGEEDIIRVQKEIAILKKLRHKNIVQLYELMETPKNIYLAMEYCEGKELFDYIIMKKQLSEAEACKFFQEIIDGIDYLHSQSIVHRDLKPENLLLDYKLSIKISDFGLSTTYTEDNLLSTACGTPSYAPPEMLRGEDYHGQLSDIWSCGVILFAMLVGYLPFSESNEELNCQKIMDGEYDIPEYLSEHCKDLLRHILHKDPLDRYDIDEVKAHPWFNSTPLRHCPGLIVGYHKIPIDERILKAVEKYGYDKETTREHIKNCKFDTMTSIYYLTLRRFVIDGGTSVSDLNSDEYIRYIMDDANLVSQVTVNKNNVIFEEAKDAELYPEEVKDTREDEKIKADGEVNLYKDITRTQKFSLKIKRKSLFIHQNLMKEIEMELRKPRRGTINIFEPNFHQYLFLNNFKRKGSTELDKENLLKLNSPKKRVSKTDKISPEMGLRILSKLEKKHEEDIAKEEELLNNTQSSISCNEITLVDYYKGNKSSGIKLLENILENDLSEFKPNYEEAKIQEPIKYEKQDTKIYQPIQTIEIPLKKCSLKTKNSATAFITRNKENIKTTPNKENIKIIKNKEIEKIDNKLIEINKKRKGNRFLSMEKQIKSDRKYVGTSIEVERSFSKSSARNISYSPNTAVKPQCKRIEVVPWNIKKRALENSANKTRLKEYEEFKKIKIEVRKKEKKAMPNIKPVGRIKQRKVNLNISTASLGSYKPKPKLVKNTSMVLSNCSSMKGSTMRLNCIPKNSSTVTINNIYSHPQKPLNKKIFVLSDNQHIYLQRFEGPLDLACMFNANLDDLLGGIQNILIQRKVVYVKTNPYKFRCSRNGISFDIEAFSLDIAGLYYTRLKYTQGDITGFRRYTQTIIRELNKIYK
jgi:serine/threonine protein kinase